MTFFIRKVKKELTKQLVERKNMLTDGKQIAAARQLLGWSQEDLATRSGVSKPTVNRMEKELFSVKDELRQKVAEAIEKSGVGFTPRGVQEKTLDVVQLNGMEGMRQFYNDIYYAAQNIGGLFFIFNGAPQLILKWLGEDWYEMHAKRMYEVGHRYNFKVIVKEGETGLIGNSFAEYRFFPAHQFYDRTIYVYGPKAAFVSFEENDVQILIINQKEIAKSMRVLCGIAWDNVAIK